MLSEAASGPDLTGRSTKADKPSPITPCDNCNCVSLLPKLTIDGNGITILTRNTNQHTAWSNIVGAEQHEAGYILLGRRGYGVLIPKRVMSDGEDATLASLIAARHVPGAPSAV
jgi:hypothetical protein